jgi:hypothetical protein
MKLLWIDLERCVADLADPFPAGPYYQRTVYFDSALAERPWGR